MSAYEAIGNVCIVIVALWLIGVIRFKSKH